MRRTTANKVETQHQLLKSQLAGALRAIQHESDATKRIERLARTLELHLTLEEDHYFPRKRADHPDLGDEIDRLLLEHAELRRCLRESAECISEGDASGASAALKRYATAFDRHEEREVELLDEAHRHA